LLLRLVETMSLHWNGNAPLELPLLHSQTQSNQERRKTTMPSQKLVNMSFSELQRLYFAPAGAVPIINNIHKILFHPKTIGVLFRMSLPGRHKPIYKRIEIVRSFKMTRLMLEQITATCDENDISFSHFLREAINQALSRYNQRKQYLEQQREKVFDSSASLVA
jgi:hypothetical protein